MGTAQVVLVGVGALGSHLTQFLRNEDIELTIVDFDAVESKNVASQFHSSNTVRKSKVQGLKQTMQFLFKKKLNVVPHKLTSDNLEQVLGDADIVIDCVDNAETRHLIKRYCVDEGIDVLHGSLDDTGQFGRVGWTVPSTGLDFTVDQETEGAATCENGEFLPFIALTSAYLAISFQKWLDTNATVGYLVSPGGVVAV